MDQKSTDNLCLSSYRIGDICLDIPLRELRRGGHIIALQPKAFELLVYLVTHRDRVVAKEELLQAICPDTVVTLSSLSRAVMKVRRALGDKDQTQLITVHGVGFRLAVRCDPAGAVDSAGTAPPAGLRRLRLVGGIIGALFGICVIVGYVYSGV